MALDLNIETIWQEGSNSCWYTNIKPTCDLCGKKSERVMELNVHDDDDSTRVCFSFSKDGVCFKQALDMLFSQNQGIDTLLTRSVEYKPIEKNAKNKSSQKREPIGLSKRYTIMKRDGFQCVLCGASGRDSLLEIDHIIPVAAGGAEAMGNLRTLCFDCNRGKGDKIE